jgi:hypothetical protein
MNTSLPIHVFYTYACNAFKYPYNETAAILAYNYIKNYPILNIDILLFIVAGNLFALLGQTKQSDTEIISAINSAKSAINHVTSATDSVKYALSAANADGYHKGGSGYTDAASARNAAAKAAAQVAYDFAKYAAGQSISTESVAGQFAEYAVNRAYNVTSEHKSAFICASGSIYLNVYKLLNSSKSSKCKISIK